MLLSALPSQFPETRLDPEVFYSWFRSGFECDFVNLDKNKQMHDYRESKGYTNTHIKHEIYTRT